MLRTHMAEERFLRELEKMRRENSEAMYALSLGDSHGHARLVGIRVGLDQAQAAYRSVAKLDDEGMNT